MVKIDENVGVFLRYFIRRLEREKGSFIYKPWTLLLANGTRNERTRHDELVGLLLHLERKL